MMLAPASIRADGGTQSRAAVCSDTVKEYAAALRGGAKFPAVVIFYDGFDYWLADGFHRVRAYEQAGVEVVPADVRQGTRRDAILYSVGANEAHGLRRTNDDKRRAVLTLLNDAEWSKWSDREIAKQCAVTHPFVAKLRPPVTGNVSSDRTYTTKHGTTATMTVGKYREKKEQGSVKEAEQARVPNTWVKFTVPDGEDIVGLCRRGIAMEENGSVPVEVAEALGLSVRTYTVSRKILLLAENAVLSMKDSATAKLALETLVTTRQLQGAWTIAEPVAVKVWGGDSKQQGLLGLAGKRLEQFERALGIVLQQCMTTEEIELPYLSADQARKAARQIGEARGALQRFAQRIKEFHE